MYKTKQKDSNKAHKIQSSKWASFKWHSTFIFHHWLSTIASVHSIYIGLICKSDDISWEPFCNVIIIDRSLGDLSKIECYYIIAEE